MDDLVYPSFRTPPYVWIHCVASFKIRISGPQVIILEPKVWALFEMGSNGLRAPEFRQTPISVQWDFQDPKMEVLNHMRPYCVGIFPYIALTYALCMVGTSNLGS